MKKFRIAAVSMALIATLGAGQGVNAAAQEVALNEGVGQLQAENVDRVELNQEIVRLAFDELNEADVPKRSNQDSTVTFELEGLELTFSDPYASTPLVSAGRESGGFWVEFTPMEQDLILSGSGAALGAAICVIPGVGWAACTVVGAIISGATVVLSHHKHCSGRIKVHYSWSGATQRSECV